MTTKAIQWTVNRILDTMSPYNKDKLKYDLLNNPQSVQRWVEGNISAWTLKAALQNPDDSATSRHMRGRHEIVEVYSHDLDEDGRQIITMLQRQLYPQ